MIPGGVHCISGRVSGLATGIQIFVDAFEDALIPLHKTVIILSTDQLNQNKK